jgi:acetate---CoA ligase (ADP-forming)
MTETLHNFFYPSNIVIIGASSRKGSIGYELTASVLDYGYTGNIFLVNPSTDQILGLPCFKNISDIPVIPELAIILVPKKFVEEVIDSSIKKGIKSFILITAGFRETGTDGELKEKKIISKIKQSGTRLVGPNCMGVINTLDTVKLNATFVAEHPGCGKTAFLSQSGALGAAVLNSLRETDIRLAHFISVGNKADISENDLIDYWENDRNIKVITLYLESFSDGNKLVELLSQNRITKPIIVLKAGNTIAGIQAASSHTGALGSSNRSVDAIFKQFGILRVDNLNDLFNTAKGFENYPLPGGGNVAIVTNAGGPAILAVDQIEKLGLTMVPLSDITREELKKHVNPEGSINNPVDLLPGGTAEIFKKVTEILLDDSNVHSVVVIFVEPVMVQPLKVVEEINSIKSDKPVFIVTMPLPEFWNLYRKNLPDGLPVFRNPEDPAVVIRKMLSYKSIRRNDKRLAPRNINMHVFNTKEGYLTQDEISVIIEKYRLPAVENKIFKFKELEKVEKGFPFVLKAEGKGIVHKSELNAVYLNISDSEELISAAEKMQDNFLEKGITIDNYILQPYIKGKYEILIGSFRDPDFGPMVMFGSGGKFVEYYKDIALKSAYLSEYDIEDMIENTVMGQLLKGARGEKPVDISEIKAAISSLAQLMLDNSQINEVDLNPVIIDENNNLFSVDIRIKVS